MWLDNLKELRKSSGKSLKQIADETKIPESTVKRIFGGDTDDPYVSTIHRIVICLGGSLDHVLADTNAVLASKTVAEVKETAGVAEAERDLLAAQNAILEDKVSTLTKEIELLQMQIKYKDEIIAIHNYYTKLKPQANE